MFTPQIQKLTLEYETLIKNNLLSSKATLNKLYEKYGLTQEEIDFIEKMIKPMGD